MNKRLVRCVGYYGGRFMSDLQTCAKSEQLWEEVRQSDVEWGTRVRLKKILTDRMFAREYMKNIDSAGDLYDLAVLWDAASASLMDLATGERYQEFQELENFAFLLHELSEVIQAFTLELCDDDRMNAYVNVFVDLLVDGVDNTESDLGGEWE